MSDSLQPHGQYPTRLLCPWNVPGKNTRVGCHFFLEGIFLTQGLNPCLLHLLCPQVDSLPLYYLGSPKITLENTNFRIFVLLHEKCHQNFDSNCTESVDCLE